MADTAAQRYAELEEEFYEEWHPAQGTNMTDMLIHKIIQLENEVAGLKKDQEPFRAQIEQRKTYKAHDD